MIRWMRKPRQILVKQASAEPHILRQSPGKAGIRGSLRLQLLSRSLLVLAVLLIFIGLFQYVLMRKFTYENKASALQSQILSLPPDFWRDRAYRQGNNESRSALPNTGFRNESSQLSNSGAENRGGSVSSVVESGNTSAASGQGNSHGRFFVPDATVALIGTDKSFTVLSEWTDRGEPPRLADSIYEKALMEAGSGREKKHAKKEYWIEKDAKGVEQLVVLRVLGSQGMIQISSDTDELKKTLSSQLLLFGCLALLALIAGLLTLLPVLRRTLTPLSDLVDTVERINAGNLDERFSAAVKPIEVGRLAGSFNRMLERLHASFKIEKEAKEHMRQFIADASHELRTPLTSIHGFLEVLLRGASSQPEQLDRALRSMYGESERLKKLVADLLALARLDSAAGLSMQERDLGATIGEMEAQLRMLAGSRSVGLVLPTGIICLHDADKIKQVVLNLFHNAVQHTDPQDGVISIMLYRTEGAIALDIRDNGSGIGPEHLPHVFDRFYRSDSSRTRKYGGSGLGLSISKSIVDAHGGTIAVISDTNQGTVFSIRLPV